VHIALLTGACTQLLRSNFEEFDIHDVPSNVSELKANPPSAWTPKLEQILSRSMSFTEYEMLSHPVMLLTVVSTTERDAVSAMQELASPHHVPQCFQNVRSSLIDVTRFIYHWYSFSVFLQLFRDSTRRTVIACIYCCMMLEKAPGATQTRFLRR
jgi:hypothetical protein